MSPVVHFNCHSRNGESNCLAMPQKDKALVKEVLSIKEEVKIQLVLLGNKTESTGQTLTS